MGELLPRRELALQLDVLLLFHTRTHIDRPSRAVGQPSGVLQKHGEEMGALRVGAPLEHFLHDRLHSANGMGE